MTAASLPDIGPPVTSLVNDALQRFQALLLADLRERLRSSRFWTVLALCTGLAWLCFPPLSAPYIVLGINLHHRGVYSSAWIGMVVGVLSVWTSLVGFYLVRGNLRRDFDTGVWELLEVTPLSRTAYLLAKWCSHLAVLALVLASQLAVGLAAQWWRAEDARIAVGQLLAPTLVIGVPSLALTATFAVWFDLVPALRRTAGHYIYAACWVAMLVLPLKALQADLGALGWLGDPRGVAVFQGLLHQRLDATLEPLHVCLGCLSMNGATERFAWDDWRVDPALLPGRLAWLLAAFAGVLLAAPLIDRISTQDRAADERAASAAAPRRSRVIEALLRPVARGRFGVLLAAELRQVFAGHGLGWWLALLGALIAQAVVPIGWSAWAALAGWLLLARAYSAAALREVDSDTTALVFSCAGASRRILLARWLTLLLAGGVATLPTLVRGLAGPPAMALATVAIDLSLASWALALGALTRNARVGEFVLVALAYLVTQHLPLLDVVATPRWTAGVHLAALPLAALVLAVAWPRLLRVIH
jgi:hypothetical protein